MKLAFSLILKDDSQAGDILKAIRGAGFAGVEPTLLRTGALPSLQDLRASAARLRGLAEEAGLSVPSMRGGPGFWSIFASDEAEQRDAAVDLARQAFDAMEILGSDTLLVVPGQWQSHQTYEQAWSNARATARRVAQAAQVAGLNVALENVGSGLILSPSEWMRFLDEVGSPFVRMYFDVGNVVSLRLGHPEQWLRQLGTKYITRIHFKDARVGGPVSYLLEGAVNWPAVRDAMVDIGYQGWVGVELDLPGHHAPAMLKATCLVAQEILDIAP